MNYNFSRTREVIRTARIGLKTIYHVEADPSYDVIKNTDNSQKELIAVRTLKGRGHILIDGLTPRIVTANTLIIFNYNRVKHYFCEGKRWNFWWFEFTLQGTLHLPLNHILNIDLLDGEHIQCNICLENLRKNKMAAKSLASAGLTSLLYQWLYNFREHRKSIDPNREKVNTIIDYMYEHLTDNLTVKSMAGRINLSVRRMRQVFKEVTGKSPKKYYDNLRIELAAELLINTHKSVKEIAYELGYSSPYHFTKVFKKYKEVAPAYYRKT
ncbi:MAG: helix-turn-helix domain-containing protein [Halanaerobiaceae bacterium]